MRNGRTENQEPRTKNREPGTENRGPRHGLEFGLEQAVARRFRIVARLFSRLVLGSWFLVLLTACLLISGPTESADSTTDGGNVYVGFVSAEGSETRVVATNFASQAIEVTVLARADSGQMRVDVLDESNASVIAVEATAEERGSSGTVQTNAQGEFRYRIQAAGAENGTLQILYLPADE